MLTTLNSRHTNIREDDAVTFMVIARRNLCPDVADDTVGVLIMT